MFHLKKIYQTFLGICSLLQGRRKLSEHTRGKITWWAKSAPHNWNNPWGHPCDSLGASWGLPSELSLTDHMFCQTIFTNPNFPFKFYNIIHWFTNLNLGNSNKVETNVIYIVVYCKLQSKSNINIVTLTLIWTNF